MAAPLDCPGIECWQELFNDTVPPDQREGYERHLESCPACQARLDRDEECAGLLRGWGQRVGDPTLTPVDPTLSQVLEQLRHEVKSPLRTTPEGPADLYFLRPADGSDLLGTLGEYEVREVIGQGGMGVVLKAFDPALHRLVAIKVLAAAVAGSAIARRRFTREAQAAAAVCHDHIVPVYGVHEEAGLPYLVMQYVAGESLQDRLDRCGPLELVDVVRIGLQTAAGLAAAHAQGLIHRDIKPANLLLENGLARVKITDFGLARSIDDVRLTQNGVVAGTPEYMAPEQARGEPVDHRADLFSLGSVLYAMSTGRPPFRAATTMAVLLKVGNETPLPIRALNPEIPAWLEGLITRLLAKDRADRFQTAAEVAELLEGYLAHLRQRDVPAPELPPLPLALQARPPKVPESPGVTRSFRPLVFPISCLVLLLVGLGMGFWFVGAGGEPGLKEKALKEYAHSLKGLPEKPADFLLVGPDANQCVKFQKDGLRITLPAGYVGARPLTGVATVFAVKGDFEITVGYEILQEPAPVDAGESGTRLTLGVVLNTLTRNAANFSRRVGTKFGSQFVAWSSTTEAPGKDQTNVKLFAAKGKTGRLRLVRARNVLSYYVSEGDSKEFRCLQQYPFGLEDVREIRLSATTGGDKAVLDLRLTDLSIHADALTRVPFPPQSVPLAVPVLGELAEHMHFSLRQSLEEQPVLRLFGPDVEAVAKVDAQGLRFTLPAERPNTDLVGVEAPLRLRGDFEVTLEYELLAVPQPAPPLGAGVQLQVTFDSQPATRAIVSRTQKPAGPLCGANLVVTGPDGKDQWQGLTLPARESRGKLRLTRSGDRLVYSIAEGAAGFQAIRRDVTTDDVTTVRAFCYTGWQPFSLDARLLDLDVRSAQMPNKPALEEKIETPVPAVRPSRERGWLTAGLLVGLVIALPFALVVWLGVRRRRKEKSPAGAADRSEPDKPRTPATVTVRCPGCGKTLKARAALAGKNARCPQCGKGVRVPPTPADEAYRPAP